MYPHKYHPTFIPTFPKSYKPIFLSFISMAFSISSSLFTTSPNFTFNSNSTSQSNSNYVKYKRSPISAAAYATTDRTTTEQTNTNINRSFRNTCSSSLYEVLGVRIGADTREVKAAYRRLARVLHPDVASSHSSADDFMKIHSAYTTLSDPEKRADYDRTLFQRPSRGVAASPVTYANASGYKSRRWETDQCW